MWSARYFDGETAEAQSASVGFSGEALTIKLHASGGLMVWHLDDIAVRYVAANKNRIDLSPRGTKGQHIAERLCVEGDHIAGQFANFLPEAGYDNSAGSLAAALKITGLLAGAMACVIFCLWLFAANIVGAIPLSWERKLGENIVIGYADLFNLDDACTGAEGQAALDAMVDQLTAGRDLLHPLEVKVFDSDIINAFAMPGGFIRISSGLIAKAPTPDMVAGVLAHEIGHVEERHSLHALSRDIILIGSIEALTGGSGLSAFLIDVAALGYSRDNEREADDFGVQMMLDAGLDPADLAAFFKLIEDMELKTDSELADQALSLMSTHPASAERFATINAQARATRQTILKDDQWQALRNICD